ncbi:MAG: hypothetical protein BGO26_14370 [Actinobacteria bacterium 69-20]|nr:hypothetical protein [Actinomycetota bacterium]OJV29507.1 MAG: hypothetical protein BGO26_14370 [Actinobacteria bacterium 69-20]
MAKTVHVLLVFSHSEGRLLSQEQFRDTTKATAAYEAAEAAHSGDENLEIVLVAADSIDTIMKTHGHYFRISDDSLFSDLLSVTASR